jgi:hypothetical protein
MPYLSQNLTLRSSSSRSHWRLRSNLARSIVDPHLSLMKICRCTGFRRRFFGQITQLALHRTTLKTIFQQKYFRKFFSLF